MAGINCALAPNKVIAKKSDVKILAVLFRTFNYIGQFFSNVGQISYKNVGRFAKAYRPKAGKFTTTKNEIN